MKIGIPREIKPLEGRVGLVPDACGELVRAGHEVYLEAGAGRASGYPDEHYSRLGVEILADAPSLYGAAALIIKVKEPVGPELGLLHSGHLLFSYLHLAAEPALMKRLLEIGLAAVGFETVEEEGRRLPLLAPMSDIAGRLSVQLGATLLQRPSGGKGVLLGGLPAAERGRVVIVGGGNVGMSAARMAAAMGAEVTLFDRNREKLLAARGIGDNVTGLYPYADQLERSVLAADLLIGAVLIPGARTPRLVSREQVAAMMPGSVIADVSVDQGGCVETTRPTTWDAPTYVEEGVVHFTVTNMPGAVPRTASQALSASVLPYALALAADGCRATPALARGVNLEKGEVIHPALREL